MTAHDLTVCSVLSGNRNFEGRIHPECKMNFLASPPLVIAYALAGTMHADLLSDPLGHDPDGNPVYLRDIWPTSGGDQGGGRRQPRGAHVHHRLRRRVRRGRELARHAHPDGDMFAWDDGLDLRAPPAVLRRHAARTRSRSRDITGARVLAYLGDSVTTDHISPAGAIKKDSPAGALPAEHGRGTGRLQLLRLPARQPRRDDPRHLRQHPAAQPAGARHRRRLHPAPAGRRDHRASSTPPLPTSRTARRWSSSPAPTTAPGPPATGRPRAPCCSASRRCLPPRSSGSTAPT